jgi:hypothetical protein
MKMFPVFFYSPKPKLTKTFKLLKQEPSLSNPPHLEKPINIAFDKNPSL